jgi:hypothetical protein
VTSGGLSEKLIDEFISKGFVITWKDRVLPAYIKSDKEYLEESIRLRKEGTGNAERTKDIKELFHELDEELEVHELEHNSIVEEATDKTLLMEINEGAKQLNLVYPGKTRKKPGRVKYQCSCGFNVWGKIGLRMKCLTCDSIFESTYASK